MSLDINSKHGIIIGGVTILIALTLFLYHIPVVKEEFNAENYEGEGSFNTAEVLQILMFPMFCFATFLCGVLLIVGIVKRWHLLLVPWLAAEVAISFNVASNPLHHLEGKLFALAIIGFQALLFYPIWNLFLEIRRCQKSKY